jgi:1,5-anhydro-D-fructose reductase (1,5-anhydro-D-mannitol-forming)
MLNCSIIGYGKMGRIRAGELTAASRAQVIGIYDPALGRDLPYKLYPSEDAAIQDQNVDAVFVCTPNYRNASLCMAALRAGKHVFCEKPPAFDANELEEVRYVEAQSGKKLMYGFNHRHHESIKKMKAIVDSREMGRILWMRGRYGKEVDESFFTGWRAKKEFAGGGIMLDQGIHMLDLLLYLGSGFDEVQSMVSNLLWKIDGIEDNVFAQFRSNTTGICASLHSTMTQWRYIFSFEVFLERGALVLNGLKTSSGAYGEEDLAVKYNNIQSGEGRFEKEERFVYHTDTSWAAEIEMFIDAVEKNGVVMVGNSKDALAVMQLIDKIYLDRKV